MLGHQNLERCEYSEEHTDQQIGRRRDDSVSARLAGRRLRRDRGTLVDVTSNSSASGASIVDVGRHLDGEAGVGLKDLNRAFEGGRRGIEETGER